MHLGQPRCLPTTEHTSDRFWHYLAIALYHWCAHKFYLHMTMSCGSWWNHHVAHTWHSVLCLITVLTIQKASNNLPSQHQVLKTFLKTLISFVLSDPLTSHFILLLLHLTLHFSQPSSPSTLSLPLWLSSILALPPLYLLFCCWLNFCSLCSLHIVPHLYYLFLRLLAVMLGDYYYSPHYCTLRASKGLPLWSSPCSPAAYDHSHAL